MGTIGQVVAQHGQKHAKRAELGVRQAARLWTEEDGQAPDFARFCVEQFTIGQQRNQLFERFEWEAGADCRLPGRAATAAQAGTGRGPRAVAAGGYAVRQVQPVQPRAGRPVQDQAGLRCSAEFPPGHAG